MQKPWIWKPSPIAFMCGPIQIRWYSIMVALSWLYALYFFDKKTLLYNKCARKWSAQAQWLSCILFFLGSRFGDWFLYQESSAPWWNILFFWEGGFSGQMGGIWALIGLMLFHSFTKTNAPYSKKILLDIVAQSIWPCMVAARIGNFLNHEIMGTETQCAWGVIFLYAEQSEAHKVTHPVQLYEAAFYFLAYLSTKKLASPIPGCFFGVFSLFASGIRILLELMKISPKMLGISMGQILSLPFFCLGGLLLIRSRKKRSI